MHIYYQSKNIHVNDKPIQDRGFFLLREGGDGDHGMDTQTSTICSALFL